MRKKEGRMEEERKKEKVDRVREVKCQEMQMR